MYVSLYLDFENLRRRKTCCEQEINEDVRPISISVFTALSFNEDFLLKKDEMCKLC